MAPDSADSDSATASDQPRRTPAPPVPSSASAPPPAEPASPREPGRPLPEEPSSLHAPSSPEDPRFPDRFDRSRTRSIKWATAGAEQDPDRIPLGVADMDLPGFPGLFEALRERARHPALGYTFPAPDSRELVADWYRDGYGVRIDPEWVVRLPFGPRAAVRFLLDALTGPGPVLAPAPEYAGFAKVAQAAGLEYRAIPLERVEGQRVEGRQGSRGGPGLRLPVGEFEERAARGPLRAVVLSSPHNPTGLVWPAEHIRRLAAAAAAAGGVLVSDEVHGDLTHPGRVHPVAVAAAGEYAEHTVTVTSVGKTFNVSGLADALLLVPSAALRARLLRAVEGHGFFEGGTVLGALAQDVALAYGRRWRDRLTAFLAGSRDLALDALAGVPGLVACEPGASYLLWLDGAALPVPAGRSPREWLLQSAGLDLQDGAAFGPAGEGFLRMNYALPRPRLREALERLACCASRSPGPPRGHPAVPSA